jgi:hypothetical protein
MDVWNAARAWLGRTERRPARARWLPRAEELETRQLLSSFHFDFGPPGATPAWDYAGVSLQGYTAQRGYGWASAQGMGYQNQQTGKPVTTDFVTGTNNTFLVDLPNGYYDLTPILGDARAAHAVSLWAQGSPLASNLTTAAGQYARPTYRVQITAGQLALRIVSAPGTTFALDGLDVNVGSGLFEHMNWNQLNNAPKANINNPYVAGAEIHLPWSMLEPAKGTFNYQLLDRFLAAWAAVGKKVVLSIKTSPDGAETNPYGGSSTPQWVYAEGAKYVTVDKKGITQQIPLAWDPVFLREYQTFVNQFAARYDGNPALEYIIVGPGVFNSTRAIYPGDIGLFRQAGYTDKVWYDTNVKIMGYYEKAFQGTHLALGMSPFINDRRQGQEYNEFKLARLAAQQGMYIDFHDLKATADWVNSPYPQFFASLGTSTKIALGMDNPTSDSESVEARYGDPVTNVQYAFGGVNGLPPINTYYIEFYLHDVTAATRGSPTFQNEYYDAMLLAWEDFHQKDKKWGA